MFEKHDFGNFYGAVFGHREMFAFPVYDDEPSRVEPKYVCMFGFKRGKTINFSVSSIHKLRDKFPNIRSHICLHKTRNETRESKGMKMTRQAKGEKLIRKAKNQINNWFCVVCAVNVPLCVSLSLSLANILLFFHICLPACLFAGSQN